MKNALTSMAALAVALSAVAPASATTFYLNSVGNTLVTQTAIVVPPSVSFAPTDCFSPSVASMVTGGCDGITTPNANGTYTSFYDFNLGSAMTLTFTSFTNAGQTVSFAPGAAVLYSNGTGAYGVSSTIVSSSGAQVQNFGNNTVGLNPVALASGKYTLALTGTVADTNSSVSSSFRFSAAAVPEPATWGLMVLGFGAVGAALRTSRRKVVFA